METTGTLSLEAILQQWHCVLPQELRNRRQWVTWQYREEPGRAKPCKFPIDSKTGQAASHSDPSTWCEFDVAVTYWNRFPQQLNGIGFVFSDDDPYCGIDFDNCRDAQTEELHAEVQKLLARLNSYSEVSPSKTGVKVIVKGSLPPWGNRKKVYDEAGKVIYGIEVYDSERYFAITGARLQEFPASVEDRRDEVLEIHRQTFGDLTASASAPTFDDATLADCAGRSLSDEVLLHKAIGARNGAEFRTLWEGDTSRYDFDDSRADLALVRLLAFWTGPDPERIDALFQKSQLCREKWTSREDYRERTIWKALDGVDEFYSGAAPGESAEAYPSSLGPAAYHGLAGEFVRLTEPHSEADPVALLVNFLVGFGNLINQAPHFVAEADRHPVRLFAALVGETSKGRKGSSWGHALRLLKAIDENWVATRILSGLSTGEGLIKQVRDPTYVDKEVNGQMQQVCVDGGVQDKRLLVVESELGRVMKVMNRQDNTLSPVLRQAWDTGKLHVLTRKETLHATDAHVSVLGHITRSELLGNRMETWTANGFGNRFLWICTRRSKSLPDGGQVPAEGLSALTRKVSQAASFALQVGEMHRDEDAKALWHGVYDDLSEGRTDLLGALTGRAEAQVMRLACLYALLDSSAVVGRVHLEAALELWRYSSESARYIFGGLSGNPDADRLLKKIRQSPKGMTRTEISEFFKRNKPKAEIDGLLSLFSTSGQVHRVEEAGEGGRTVERWVTCLNS